MSKTITLTDEQMASLEAGEAITIQPPKPKLVQWDPEGGDYWISSTGIVCRALSSGNASAFGVERPTLETAQKAANAMRVYNRLLAYVDQYTPDYEPDWDNNNQVKYFVYCDHATGVYDYIYNTKSQDLAKVYMPEWLAEQLCKQLNEGSVVL